MVMNVNIAPSHIIIIVLFMKDMVVTMLVLQINLLVLTLFVNLYILWTVINLLFFSPVYKVLHTSNICINKTVSCSVSCKHVSDLINSAPAKSFDTCRPVCFSNVSMTKAFHSVNYSLIICTEYPLNVISSVASYRAACSVNFGIVVQAVNVTLLCIYRCVSFKISHHIASTLISVLENPLHFTGSPSTLSVWLSP